MGLLKIINRIFGLFLLITLPFIFLSIFLFPRLTISNHIFNLPGILIILFFFSIFVFFISKPFLKEDSVIKLNYFSKVYFWIAMGVDLILIILASYFILYLPITHVLLLESDEGISKPLTFEGNKGMQLYLEIGPSDFSSFKGEMIEITVSNNNWNYTQRNIIAKESRGISNGGALNGKTYITDFIFVNERLPADGTYNIFINPIDPPTIRMREIRIFGK